MAPSKNGAGHGEPDRGGCTDNHCHGKKLRSETEDAPFGMACHQAAGRGTKHPGIGRCHSHGGATPTHEASARRILAEQAAATYGLPVDVDPAQALLDEVHRTAGHVAWLGALIAGMEERDLVWGLSEETVMPGGDGEGGGTITKHKAGASVWLDLYQRERKHLAAVARDALGADAAGRVTAVIEQIGGRFVELFDRSMEQAGLTEQQRAAVAGVLVGELRAAEGNGR